MAPAGRPRTAPKTVPHGFPEGPPPPGHDFNSPQFPRIDPSDLKGMSGGTPSPLGTRAPINIAMGRRTALGIGAGVGVSALALGAGVGLAEGIPQFFGGQGPINAAVNPDKPKDPNNPLSALSNPLVVLGLIAAVVAVMVLS